MLRWVWMAAILFLPSSQGPPIQLDRPTTVPLQRRLPRALIIGVKKCGTRALLEFAKINPRISAPGPEVHFFDKHFDKGFDWYGDQMPLTTADQITIEKSPAYFVGKEIPKRVHHLDPNMKLIVVVRNPITRAISGECASGNNGAASDYTQARTRKKRSSDFEALASCSDNSTTKCIDGLSVSWSAIRIGLYYNYLKEWLRYFPLHQMLFIDGERLIRNPAEEVNKVEKFLGLEPVVKPADFIMNPKKGFPCFRRPNSTEPHCLGKTKGRVHPQVDQDLINRLQNFYRPANERFFRLIHQHFHWY